MLTREYLAERSILPSVRQRENQTRSAISNMELQSAWSRQAIPIMMKTVPMP